MGGTGADAAEFFRAGHGGRSHGRNGAAPWDNATCCTGGSLGLDWQGKECTRARRAEEGGSALVCRAAPPYSTLLSRSKDGHRSRASCESGPVLHTASRAFGQHQLTLSHPCRPSRHRTRQSAMSEDELDFDFGTWCPVCDRAISVPAPAASPDERPAISPAASHHSAKVKRTPSTAEKKDGIGGRKKSSGKLHHPRHGKSHSHTSLHTLAVSTPLHPPPVTPPTPSEEEQAHLNPPSSLYCSEECRRIDEMRSRLAFAHLGPSSTSTAVRPLLDHSRRHSMGGARESEEPSEAVSRRRSSGLSLRVQARSGASYGMTNGYSSGYSGLESGSFAGGGGGGGGGGREQNMGLDFSTRRNSRGSEGAYSFRPSLMQRVPSTEEGSYGTRSRGSTDSLASMGEADERSDRGYSGAFSLWTLLWRTGADATHLLAARPPSALSALRFMTPISPLPSSSPTRARRPPNLLRNNTDAPRATVFRADSPNEGRRVSPNATGSKSKQINSPPMPSPRALAGGSESCPDQSTEGLAEIEAVRLIGSLTLCES